MTSACVVEQLSSYLDGEVSPKAQREIKEHLNNCPECQHQLEGLRTVVGRLASLERVMPPLNVSEAVHRSATFISRESRYTDRWERFVHLLRFESSVLPFLALVVALGGIALVFTSALERSQTSKRSRLIWVGPAEEAAPAVEAGSAPEDSLTVSSRVVRGRTFDQLGGSWVERGVDPLREPDRQGQATSFELAPYSELRGRVLLVVEGKVVEVFFGESSAESDYSSE
jgi:hypothetical protein